MENHLVIKIRIREDDFKHSNLKILQWLETMKLNAVFVLLSLMILNIDFLNFTHSIFTTSRYPNTHIYLTVGCWISQLAHPLGFELSSQLGEKIKTIVPIAVQLVRLVNNVS